MKFPLIQQFVPQGEHFDESAIINEGGFLSVAHLAAIESQLAAQAPALEQANAMINDHIATIAQLNDSIAGLEAANNAEKEMAALQLKEIADLQLQVAELGKQNSGTGTRLSTNDDGGNEGNEGKLPKWDSPEHPANQLADKFTPKKK